MTGTIFELYTTYMSKDWTHVKITVMPHPENGVPIEDVVAGFYVKNKKYIPRVNEEVDLFYHNRDKCYYVALEGDWYESMFDSEVKIVKK